MGTYGPQPYRVIGIKLRQLREAAKQSLVEVSGAVEIDEYTLSQIESGTKRPDEDVLMLLLSYFDVSDNETLKLWELAGYSKPDTDNADEVKQIMMIIAQENRILFADSSSVLTTDGGVIINFGVSAGDVKSQQVSKLGMSLESAKELSRNIDESIKRFEQSKVPKMLPAPKQKSDKKKS